MAKIIDVKSENGKFAVKYESGITRTYAIETASIKEFMQNKQDKEQNSAESKIFVNCQSDYDNIPDGFTGEIIIKSGCIVISNSKVYASGNSKVYASGNSKVYASGNSEVTASGNSKVYAYGNSKVYASGNSKVYANGNSEVTASGNSKVYASGNSKVTVSDNSEVTASGNSKVYAYGNSKVYAYGNSEVYAYGNSKVYANGNSEVTASGNSKVYASDNSEVTASDNITVIAHGNSKVYASGNSKVTVSDNSEVTASGNSEVYASGNSKVYASGNSEVIAHDNITVIAHGNSKVTAFGNVQIVSYQSHDRNFELHSNSRVVHLPKTGKDFADFHGLLISDSKVQLFKAVHKCDEKYISGYDPNFTYEIGKCVSADCNTNPYIECGSGINCGTLSASINFGRWENVAILKLEVDIDDIVTIANVPDKVRVSKAKVLCEVPLEQCGALGRILAERNKK